MKVNIRIKKIRKLKVRAKAGPRRHAVNFWVATKSKKRKVQVLPAAPPAPVASWTPIFSWGFKALAGTMAMVLLSLSFFSAFEAHIVNISAELIQIDPPVLTPPGEQIPWHNPIGGTDLTAPVDVFFSDPDPDATHIYFTYATGTDPLIVPDPVCGQTGPGGGGGLKIDVEIVALILTGDTVIKAVACDGDDIFDHASLINTKIYTFLNECPAVPVDFPDGLALLVAGTGAGNDDILLGSGSVVNGDARSNDDINEDSGSGSANDPDINGNATAGDDVDSDIDVSGTTTEGAAATTLPDLNLPIWEDRAALGGTVNGSLFFPDNTSGIELGPTKITGNLTFNENNDVSIKGPIHVLGNLIIDDDTTITQDLGFGDNFVVIIVDGTIDIEDDVTFVGASSIGTILLVSKNGAVNGSSAAIDVSSDSSDIGDVVLFAQNGDIHVRDARDILAAFAKSGGNSAALDLDAEGVVVNYRTLPDNIICGEPFDTLSAVLINEFMPNPDGTDLGTAGLPLDGEWVELWNGLTVPVDVNGWVLYDDNDANELIIGSANVNASSTIIYSGGLLVVYREGDADFALNNSGADSVRLYNAEIGSGGVLVDSHDYIYPDGAGDNKSFARTPDGTANWVDPEGTPGEPNLEFYDPNTTPSEPVVFEEDLAEQTAYDGEALVETSDESASSTDEPEDNPAAPELSGEVSGVQSVEASREGWTETPSSTPIISPPYQGGDEEGTGEVSDPVAPPAAATFPTDEAILPDEPAVLPPPPPDPTESAPPPAEGD